jgi:hypothetical protein
VRRRRDAKSGNTKTIEALLGNPPPMRRPGPGGPVSVPELVGVLLLVAAWATIGYALACFWGAVIGGGSALVVAGIVGAAIRRTRI